jgi:hypothetical protein
MLSITLLQWRSNNARALHGTRHATNARTGVEAMIRRLAAFLTLCLALAAPAGAQTVMQGPAASTSFTASGGGTVAISPADRAGQTTNAADFGATLSTAMAPAQASAVAKGGGLVLIPANFASAYTYAFPDPSIVMEWNGPNINRVMTGLPGVATDSGKAFSGVLGTTRPSGNNRAGVSDFFFSQGSGANGANHGDFAHSFQLYKENYSCSTARQAATTCPTVALQGEDDTLYLSLFQGGPDAASDPNLKSAGGLATGGANCMDGTGFCLQTEFTTNILDKTTLAIISSIDIQTGGIDTRVGELSGYGVSYGATTGTQTGAIHVISSAGAAWGNVLDNAYQGATNYTMSDNGVMIFGASSSPTNEVVLTTTGSLAGRTQTGGLQVQDGNGLVKAKVNKDGSGGFSTGLVDTNTPAWTNGASYVDGQIAQNAGNIYRVANVVGGVAANAPVHGSGCVTGADTTTWCFVATAADATVIDFTGGAARIAAPLYIRSAQTTPVDVPIIAVAGSPNAVVTSPTGGIAIRTNGGPSQVGYINESGTLTGWNPIITASTSTSITATGTTLAGAVALTARWNVITTAAASTGVSLKGNTFTDEQVIINRGANTVNVYPPSASVQIDALGLGVAATIATNGKAGYYCVNTIQCYTVR